jgi:hypothetical protein
MSMNLMTTLLPHVVIWAVLTTIVIFLAIYRRRVGSTVDETLHVLDAEAPTVDVQAQVARKLAIIDRWGKILTVIAALYLLGIAATIIYSILQDQGIKMS